MMMISFIQFPLWATDFASVREPYLKERKIWLFVRILCFNSNLDKMNIVLKILSYELI